MPATNDGRVVRVSPDRLDTANQRLSELEEQAKARGEHLWVVTSAFSISDDVARWLADGEDPAPLLDHENLLSMAPGCFICEEPLTRRLYNRRCRGEPDE